MKKRLCQHFDTISIILQVRAEYSRTRREEVFAIGKYVKLCIAATVNIATPF